MGCVQEIKSFITGETINISESYKKLNVSEAIESYKYEIGRYYSREKSWELCYKSFQEAVISEQVCSDEKKKQLAVELSCYLASFGMYRNSLLLNVNYLALVGVVSSIVKEENKCLVGEAKNNTDRIITLSDEIINTLNIVREKSETERNITDTLISKILLGTFGCVVAYDDVVRKRLNLLFPTEKKYLTHFSKDSINFLYKIYDSLNIHKAFNGFDGLTPMREMDIVLWFGDEENLKKSREGAKR